MMSTVPHVISGLELRKLQADGFLSTRVYLLLCNRLSIYSTHYRATVVLLSIIYLLFVSITQAYVILMCHDPVSPT